MSTKKDREFSDNEVRMARIFCVVVGAILGFVGVKLAGGGTSVPQEVAWAAAAVGLVIALFGLLAPRRKCVSAAGFILTLIG